MRSKIDFVEQQQEDPQSGLRLKRIYLDVEVALHAGFTFCREYGVASMRDLPEDGWNRVRYWLGHLTDFAETDRDVPLANSEKGATPVILGTPDMFLVYALPEDVIAADLNRRGSPDDFMQAAGRAVLLFTVVMAQASPEV
jgi:hypothetical protein